MFCNDLFFIKEWVVKRIAMKFVFLWLAFFGGIRCGAEGFATGTLVKVPDGYQKIEDLRVGDCVLCCDEKQNFAERPVVFLAKRVIERYVSVCVGDEYVHVACDQRFYSEKNDTWITASDLEKCDTFGQHTVAAISLVEKSVDVYLIGVAEYHNFFVTTADICAHNFFPPLVLAITAVFGFGTIEIAGVSFGLAGLGTFLGYQWHKKSKKHNIVMQPQLYGGGMEPEDPENEKKRQRDQAIQNFQSLTKKEAQEIAEEFGHKKVKSHPCGNTRNQPVFFNGKNYISPDIDGHNGGLWKVFDRRGNILHTTSRRFEKVVKIYKK